MFFRTKKVGTRTYLQIAENWREEGRLRQRVLATLGRLEDLQSSGALDSLLQSGARFAQSLLILSEHQRGTLPAVSCQRIGPSLVFGRLWAETGCQAALDVLLRGRKVDHSVERAIFLTVLHRLIDPGSDRAAERWRQAYRIPGAGDLGLHHLYRAMAWLGEELPSGQQIGQTGFSLRCRKDLIEEKLFQRRRDLFSGLDLVFFDTTSIYFEGEGDTLGQRGHSKDHRPDLNQMVVGAVLDGEGRPVCCEMWPGNTTDVKSLIPVVNRLQQRFAIERVCVVADRGMVSAETRADLERRGWLYILGARMRRQNEVKEKVLGRAGRYQVVQPERQKSTDLSPLKVKEVHLSGQRFIVCLNEEQARKDAADRQAILDSLAEQLKAGAKSLIGNKGYRRYLKSSGNGFSIDEDKVIEESRFDGKWVLVTNTDLPASDVALKYKQLWMVETIFRTLKSLLETRPIYHKRDATIRGHVFCSFLALVLRKELQDRLDRSGRGPVEWNDLIRDLDQLEEIQVENQGQRFALRTAPRPGAVRAFQAAGVAIPPALRQPSGTVPPARPEAPEETTL